ncbi:hypothetical protein HPP92_026533 [Vanilla planifolia]|uniref:Uncharacterized protein n=1 Tax=Vanilla planifolia TaxID=51239 RepID=A0A835PE99_VANPL|nr:hypothetical protein HPP92_026533 [Vanilla planifolia]
MTPAHLRPSPITSVYTPPSHCPDLLLRSPSRIVLEWSAASAGLQFDPHLLRMAIRR